MPGAQDLATLEVITFPGTADLPFHVGAEKGFFAEAGVRINLTATPNSVYQITNLVAGKYHLAGTAIDNIIAYQEGQGAVALDTEPDLCVFMGASGIELSFVVAPEIETFGDLKGRSLALDALSTGFAFILYRMLEDAGLTPDDYDMASVGGTPARLEALRSGAHAGALLNDPFTDMALAEGFRKLHSSLDAVPRYQSGIFAGSRAWAAANRDALVGYIKGYLDSQRWILDPANRPEATEILARHMPQLSPDAVVAAMARTLSPRTGLTPEAALDLGGVRTVLELRSRYGVPRKALSDPEKYIDLSYYEAARALG